MRKYLLCGFRFIFALLIAFSYLFSPLTVQAKEATTILELKDHLAELEAEKSRQANAKKQTQSEINQSKNNIYNAYQEKEKNLSEVEDAKNKVTQAEEDIKQASEDIDNMLRYYQLTRNGNDYMDYFSDASSITDLIMRIKSVESITKYYDNKIKSLQDLIVEKQNRQVELENANKELDNSINNFSNALSTLNDKMAAINEISEDIDTQIAAQKSVIKYYQSICDSETQKLSTCTSDPQSFGWLKPTVKGRLSSGYGYRTFDNSFHPGVDVAGNGEGTLEYATAAGRVAAITNRSSCGGNMVYIHVTVNGKKYTIQYAHMLEIKVKLNQIVTTDTVVGTVGGYSTSKYYNPKGGYDNCAYGAHLHYGVATGWYHVDYSSWNQFVAHLIQPPGFPNIGVWWYKR